MEINAGHASVILKRICDSQDPFEQIEVISGKDKRRIPIHRVVLNAASKYFTGLLGPNFQEEKPKEFLLDDSDGATIKSVVNFCYTGNINLTDENVENILEIATRVEMDLLEDKCREFYLAKLGVDHAVTILTIADKYRFAELRERAFNLICEKFETVPAGDWEKLSRKLLQELLKCDKIHEFGDLAATRLLEWFQCDEDGRDVHMPELLKLIRLEHLTAKFLTDTFEAVCKRFKCNDLMFAEYKRRTMLHGRSDLANAECVTRPRRQHNVIRESVPHARSTFGVILQYSDDIPQIIVEKYNDTTKCFDEATKIPVGSRKFFGAVLHKNKIFVLGGFERNKYLKSVFSHDLTSGMEERLPDMKVALCNMASILVGKHIYVFGGVGNPCCLNSCERFDTEDNKWETLRSMSFSHVCTLVAVLNGYIYIVDSTGTAFEVYDPKTDKWTQLASMRRSVIALVESNGFLYAMGSNEVKRYDPHTNRWTKIGRFHASNLITRPINIDGKLFAIMTNGEFGRIEIDENHSQVLFVPLGKAKYRASDRNHHFLFHV